MQIDATQSAASTYQFSVVQGVKRLTGITGAVCPYLRSLVHHL